ncbi:hypothetical protein DB88DRAFT_513135 [Papiliotrema laurentii]|uniref:Uncharacterized protein n=1 Tax=Papiliotrema laurentii TaxID=5418 RepID=A0AAD9CW84_PAPLA|nr:hypothetical protein DB88DRAFT_513135 [Papiliotrema laurentii]
MSLTQTPSAVNAPVPTAQPTAILKQAEPRKTSTATQAHPTPGSLSRSYLDGQSPRGLGYTLTHTTPTGVPPMASSRVAALKRPIGSLRGRGSGPGDTPMNSLSSLGKAAKPVPARLTSSDEDQAINQQPPNKIPSSYQRAFDAGLKEVDRKLAALVARPESPRPVPPPPGPLNVPWPQTFGSLPRTKEKEGVPTVDRFDKPVAE